MTSPSVDYRTIPLTQGQHAIVDAGDFDWLASYKWCAMWHPRRKRFVAVRSGGWANGKAKPLIYMHREILGLKAGDPREGDHVEPSETLDNRRGNLRISTSAQNGQNVGPRKRNKCGLKGVHFNKNAGKWMARINANKKSIYLGLFTTKEAAHDAYCAAAKIHHGQFARTK